MMNTSSVLGIVIPIGFAALTALAAMPAEDMSPISPALSLRAEGLILARCSVCHSADLITQQRLPSERWEATVEKMKHWGADISQDEAGLLMRYLSARYHPDAPDRLPPLEHEAGPAEPLTQEPASTGPLVGVAKRGAGIFEHNCQACHGQGGIGGVGPQLSKNPILSHEDLFWDTVLHGRGPMPAWGSILSEQDIADVHAWLLSR
ncbi:MAG TPA: c-type cytochrome [Nitrospira sp.]|nr:c-type cytochrome [Nitrospira sp.]